ncbi:DUF2281 domain-containing protein [Methanospirillum sp.]
MTITDIIEQRARNLPPEYQQMVLDFIDSLFIDNQRIESEKPCLNWAGALSNVNEDVFSLQKKALLWRDTDEISD